MDNLIKRLLIKQPIDFEARTDSLEELRERLIDRKFVFITFIEPKGETKLGIDVDLDSTDIMSADFNKGIGNIRVVGTCELDYQKVRCIADVDLSTKKGLGYLEFLH